jgi:hypothetical protein
VRISSWRSWECSRPSVIQNQTVRSLQACSPNCGCSLSAISRTPGVLFKRNLMMTLWSYSIRKVPWTDFKVQNGKIIMPSVAYSTLIWSVSLFERSTLWR